MLWPAVKLVSVLLWKLFLSCFFSKRPGAKIAKNEACHRRQTWNQNPGAVFVPPLQTASILSPPGGPAFGTPVLEFSLLARANFPALCSIFIRLFPACVSFFGNASARVCRCMIYALAVAWSPRMRLFLLNSAPCPAAMPACTFATATLNKGASAQAHELSLEPHDMDAYSLFTMGAMQLSDGRTKLTLIVAVMIWAACALARLHTHTVYIYIWSFPEMGVPPNRPFLVGYFPQKRQPANGVPPIYGNPPHIYIYIHMFIESLGGWTSIPMQSFGSSSDRRLTIGVGMDKTEPLRDRLDPLYGDFLKWGYPKMDGL